MSATIRTAPLIVTEAEIRSVMTMQIAIESARAAFRAIESDAVVAPPSWSLDLPDRAGEVHVKGAYIGGHRDLVVKVATGFERNPAAGLPAASGFSSVLDATTGFVRALLLDNSYLTELRAGAAGALSVDLLARADAATAVVVGTGGQARFQIEGLLQVRPLQTIVIVGRSLERAGELAEWTRTLTDAVVTPSVDLESAVRSADVVLTVTSAATPIIRRDWVRAGTHVTAIGSDAPWKRELDPALVCGAERLVVDDLAQSATLGELKGIDIQSLARPAVTLGAVLLGTAIGRSSAADITVADLGGLGIQDVAIAEALLSRL